MLDRTSGHVDFAAMEARDLRKAFRDFFVDKGHTPVESASLIPHDRDVHGGRHGAVQTLFRR